VPRSPGCSPGSRVNERVSRGPERTEEGTTVAFPGIARLGRRPGVVSPPRRLRSPCTCSGEVVPARPFVCPEGGGPGGRDSEFCRGDSRRCSSFLRMTPASAAGHDLPRQEALCSAQVRAAQSDAGTARLCPQGHKAWRSPHRVEVSDPVDVPGETSQSIWNRSPPGGATGALGPWRAVPAPHRAAAPVTHMSPRERRTPEKARSTSEMSH